MLYAFIRSLNLEEKLIATAEDYKAMREEGLYSEQVQVYGMLIDAMD